MKDLNQPGKKNIKRSSPGRQRGHAMAEEIQELQKRPQFFFGRQGCGLSQTLLSQTEKPLKDLPIILEDVPLHSEEDNYIRRPRKARIAAKSVTRANGAPAPALGFAQDSTPIKLSDRQIAIKDRAHKGLGMIEKNPPIIKESKTHTKIVHETVYTTINSEGKEEKKAEKKVTEETVTVVEKPFRNEPAAQIQAYNIKQNNQVFSFPSVIQPREQGQDRTQERISLRKIKEELPDHLSLSLSGQKSRRRFNSVEEPSAHQLGVPETPRRRYGSSDQISLDSSRFEEVMPEIRQKLGSDYLENSYSSKKKLGKIEECEDEDSIDTELEPSKQPRGSKKKQESVGGGSRRKRRRVRSSRWTAAIGSFSKSPIGTKSNQQSVRTVIVPPSNPILSKESPTFKTQKNEDSERQFLAPRSSQEHPLQESRDIKLSSPETKPTVPELNGLELIRKVESEEIESSSSKYITPRIEPEMAESQILEVSEDIIDLEVQERLNNRMRKASIFSQGSVLNQGELIKKSNDLQRIGFEVSENFIQSTENTARGSIISPRNEHSTQMQLNETCEQLKEANINHSQSDSKIELAKLSAEEIAKKLNIKQFLKTSGVKKNMVFNKINQKLQKLKTSTSKIKQSVNDFFSSKHTNVTMSPPMTPGSSIDPRMRQVAVLHKGSDFMSDNKTKATVKRQVGYGVSPKGLALHFAKTPTITGSLTQQNQFSSRNQINGLQEASNLSIANHYASEHSQELVKTTEQFTVQSYDTIECNESSSGDGIKQSPDGVADKAICDKGDTEIKEYMMNKRNGLIGDILKSSQSQVGQLASGQKKTFYPRKELCRGQVGITTGSFNRPEIMLKQDYVLRQSLVLPSKSAQKVTVEDSKECSMGIPKAMIDPKGKPQTTKAGHSHVVSKRLRELDTQFSAARISVKASREKSTPFQNIEIREEPSHISAKSLKKPHKHKTIKHQRNSTFGAQAYNNLFISKGYDKKMLKNSGRDIGGNSFHLRSPYYPGKKNPERRIHKDKLASPLQARTDALIQDGPRLTAGNESQNRDETYGSGYVLKGGKQLNFDNERFHKLVGAISSKSSTGAFYTLKPERQKKLRMEQVKKHEKLIEDIRKKQVFEPESAKKKRDRSRHNRGGAQTKERSISHIRNLSYVNFKDEIEELKERAKTTKKNKNRKRSLSKKSRRKDRSQARKAQRDMRNKSMLKIPLDILETSDVGGAKQNFQVSLRESLYQKGSTINPLLVSKHPTFKSYNQESLQKLVGYTKPGDYGDRSDSVKALKTRSQRDENSLKLTEISPMIKIHIEQDSEERRLKNKNKQDGGFKMTLASKYKTAKYEKRIVKRRRETKNSTSSLNKQPRIPGKSVSSSRGPLNTSNVLKKRPRKPLKQRRGMNKKKAKLKFYDNEDSWKQRSSKLLPKHSRKSHKPLVSKYSGRGIGEPDHQLFANKRKSNSYKKPWTYEAYRFNTVKQQEISIGELSNVDSKGGASRGRPSHKVDKQSPGMLGIKNKNLVSPKRPFNQKKIKKKTKIDRNQRRGVGITTTSIEVPINPKFFIGPSTPEVKVMNEAKMKTSSSKKMVKPRQRITISPNLDFNNLNVNRGSGSFKAKLFNHTTTNLDTSGSDSDRPRNKPKQSDSDSTKDKRKDSFNESLKGMEELYQKTKKKRKLSEKYMEENFPGNRHPKKSFPFKAELRQISRHRKNSSTESPMDSVEDRALKPGHDQEIEVVITEVSDSEFSAFRRHFERVKLKEGMDQLDLKFHN